MRASKEKEQQLQSQLATVTVEQELQDKEQQLSKLEDGNQDLHKMMILKHEYEWQREKLVHVLVTYAILMNVYFFRC